MVELSDVLLILGTCAATGGIWWISPPAALIILGIWLVVLGIRLSRQPPTKRRGGE